MKFSDIQKAIKTDAVFKINSIITDPKEIGEALIRGDTVLGTFHDPELFGGNTCLHVYKIKKHAMFHMVLLSNGDLHLISMLESDDLEYKNVVPLQILSENEVVFLDQDEVIDITKAYTPDTPHETEIRDILDS